jgi:hypothetical protein
MTRPLRVGGIAAFAILATLALLVAPAMAAAPTPDSETANSPTTSDWTDGTTVPSFEANSSNTSYIEAQFDSTNASIEILDPNTGEVHASNSTLNQTYADATNNTWHYAWNLSHDALATMPMDAGENKSVTVKFINDSNHANPDTTEITVYLENQDDRAVVYAGDAADAGNITGLSASTAVDEGWFGLGSTSATTTVEADNVGLVNASGTRIDVIVANTSGEDSFSEADDQALWGSYDTGEFHKGHQLHIANHNHAVFNQEAADYVVNDYTYAVTSTINGNDAYRIHVADDYSGESTLDVKTVANDKYGPWESMTIESAAKDGVLANSFLAFGSPVGTGLVA